MAIMVSLENVQQSPPLPLFLNGFVERHSKIYSIFSVALVSCTVASYESQVLSHSLREKHKVDHISSSSLIPSTSLIMLSIRSWNFGFHQIRKRILPSQA